MRFRTKILMLMPLLVLGVGWFSVSREVEQLNLASSEVNREDANREIAVRIDREHWTVFQLPSRAETVRLMSNAAFRDNISPPVNQADPRPGWRYGIEYQLLDAHGNIMVQSEYNFRSRIRELIDS